MGRPPNHSSLSLLTRASLPWNSIIRLAHMKSRVSSALRRSDRMQGSGQRRRGLGSWGLEIHLTKTMLPLEAVTTVPTSQASWARTPPTRTVTTKTELNRTHSESEGKTCARFMWKRSSSTKTDTPPLPMLGSMNTRLGLEDLLTTRLLLTLWGNNLTWILLPWARQPSYLDLDHTCTRMLLGRLFVIVKWWVRPSLQCLWPRTDSWLISISLRGLVRTQSRTAWTRTSTRSINMRGRPSLEGKRLTSKTLSGSRRSEIRDRDLALMQGLATSVDSKR